LTEGVVAGTRVGRELSWLLPEKCPPVDIDGGALLESHDRRVLREAMSRNVGVLRRPEGLAVVREIIDDLAAGANVDVVPSLEAFEATNLLTVAAAVVGSAELRTESRGCHRRVDHPEPRDEWRRHITVQCEDGVMGFES
jgi:L-aspartate oxidase